MDFDHVPEQRDRWIRVCNLLLRRYLSLTCSKGISVAVVSTEVIGSLADKLSVSYTSTIFVLFIQVASMILYTRLGRSGDTQFSSSIYADIQIACVVAAIPFVRSCGKPHIRGCPAKAQLSGLLPSHQKFMH